MKTEEITEEYSEKLVPLTQEEIAVLKKNRWKAVLGILVFSVFWYSVLFFIFGTAPDGFFSVFIAIFALAPLVILGMILWNAKRDIDFGQKQLIRGRLDSKREETRTSGTGKNRSTSTYYYFSLSGKDITVKLQHYNEFQTGDIIEIEMMPKSGDVLKMRELQSNLVRDGEKPVFKSDFEKKNKEFFKETHYADTAQLSMEEENLLKKLRNKRGFVTLLVCGVVGFVSYYILFFVLAVGAIFLNQAYPDFFKTLFGGYPGKILHYGVIAFVTGIAALILYKRVGGLQRDLNEGRKQIFKTVVGDKLRSNVKIIGKNWRVTSSRGDFYYAVIDGNYYPVSPEQFLKLECGEKVKLHVAPHSKTLLKIEGI